MIDEIMKKYNSDDESLATNRPSTSFSIKSQLSAPTPTSIAPTALVQPFQTLSQTLNQTLSQTLNQTLNQGLQINSNLAQNLQHTLNQSLASSLAAGLSTGLSPMNLGLMHNGLSPSSPLLSTQIQQKISPLPSELMKYNPGSVSTDYDGSDERLHGVESKIKKNKDGKPRKRSQHTKGNKLWEFIRDALKDPSTCPSVVRWEDPIEGVFRIVESERLARLWGERKNNTKMTYEKLSRAMRYYYNTKILLPVSGRRLVYKFGPTARGWSTQNPIFYPSYSCETDESDEDGIDHVSYQFDPIQFPTPMTYPELPV